MPWPTIPSPASKGRRWKAARAPALGDHQARKLLDAPQGDSLKSKRDRAILSTLLFHALRREELSKLKVKDARHSRKGVVHLKVSGKGGKIRYVPLHPGTSGLIHDYLATAGHEADEDGALFRPMKNNATGRLDLALTANGVYELVREYSAALGLRLARTRCAQRLRRTRSITRPTSPRCRNGWATRTSPPRASTITGKRGPRTARLSDFQGGLLI
jgi:integrase